MPKDPWVCPCHNGENGSCQVDGSSCNERIPKDCPLDEYEELVEEIWKAKEDVTVGYSEMPWKASQVYPIKTIKKDSRWIVTSYPKTLEKFNAHPEQILLENADDSDVLVIFRRSLFFKEFVKEGI